jgi:hypothetical protein
MDSSSLANSYFRSEVRRVCIFGLCLETLSPGPLCMHTLIPTRVCAIAKHWLPSRPGMGNQRPFWSSLALGQLPGVKRTLPGSDSRRPESNVGSHRKQTFSISNTRQILGQLSAQKRHSQTMTELSILHNHGTGSQNDASYFSVLIHYFMVKRESPARP